MSHFGAISLFDKSIFNKNINFSLGILANILHASSVKISTRQSATVWHFEATDQHV